MSSSPAVLVIGASGAIGSPLINDLGPDHQVGGLRLVAATRKEEAARSLRERGIEMRHLDPEVAETGGLDAIQPASPASTGYSSSAATTYACSSSPRRPSTRRMGRSSQVVHLGASAAGNTTISNLSWHLLIEAYMEPSGLGFTHVRPTGFMQNLLLSAAAPGVPSYFSGAGRG